MPHILEDRVLESTTSTGTGAITLAGAVTGFRRFNAVCAVGDTVPYFIEAVDSVGLPTGDYEYGVGTYSAADTLTRTTVLGSSNGGAAVVFAAGSKNVGIAAFGRSLVPPGAVFYFATSTAPAGYLKADGTAVSRTTYAGLFATIGTTFGAGDGSTTFNLPDLRGEFIRGLDDGRGVDGLRALGSAQADAFKSHQHTYAKTSAGVATFFGGSGPGDTFGDSNTLTTATGGTETRPRNVALLACIKT